MDENRIIIQVDDQEKLNINSDDTEQIIYDVGKDFYVGAQGELRLKAEGLFKKAREKGISIEDVEVMTLKENTAEFPGIGTVDLPTYIAKVKGRLLTTGQVITDGKQIDYYNRYQKYIARKIEQKNIMRDERGNKVKVKSPPDLFLTEWERFEIGKALIEDKDFGLEKTITGACDRIIRKLMGENDWLYPGEAALLDEEFEDVQQRVKRSQEKARNIRKASDKQINYFKSKINNAGLNADDSQIINIILEEMGHKNKGIQDLSVSQMSEAIDKVSNVIPVVKERFVQKQ